MCLLRFFVIAVLLMVVNACDPRVPLTKGQVISIADMKLELEGKSWGVAREVIPPDDTVDAKGRRFWTVRYAPGEEQALRVVFVNDETNWAHIRKPDGMRDERELAQAKVPTQRVQNRDPKILQESRYPSGSFILIVASGEFEGMQAEANRLNTLAVETGLIPQFSVRKLPSNNSQLVYGWNGDHGIRKNEKISNWIQLRTAYRQFHWLDLLGD